MPNEQRLDQLKREALSHGVVRGRGVDIAGGPIPHKPGYYGESVVRPPVWTWEIPVYFSVGGLGGMSAVIAAGAEAVDYVDLGRTAMLVALVAAILSPILLILDLGRPSRFINMLRVFKPRSPMSLGVWILVAFGLCVFPCWLGLELSAREVFTGTTAIAVHKISGILLIPSAILGVLLATYTGVLVGATVIPAWFLHRTLLPAHFGIASLGSSAALLELLGYHFPPLNALGFFAAGVETLLALWLLLDRHGAADRALHRGGSGLLIQAAEVFTGPLSLLFRWLRLLPLAGILFLLGALVSRFAWMWAGRVSGRDPEAVFASQRN